MYSFADIEWRESAVARDQSDSEELPLRHTTVLKAKVNSAP